MHNLFLKGDKSPKLLAPVPFASEEDFERFVFDAPEILGDIFLLKRQVRGGRKPGIPDIVGIDKDNNVYIIEMKNVTVDATIIPQVLQYAFWAEMNPDSIKSLWLQAKGRPDFDPDWDDVKIRIVIIAPEISRSTLHMVRRVRYETDLIEIVRWHEKSNTLLLVNHLESDEEEAAPRTVRGLENYDADYYRKGHNSESVDQFMAYVTEVETLAQKQGWKVEKKFNKHTCAFKIGFFRAFGVWWDNKREFSFFFRASKSDAKLVKRPVDYFWSGGKDAAYCITPGKTKTKDFLPLFERAYRNVAGS
jgi:hypothetical protein